MSPLRRPTIPQRRLVSLLAVACLGGVGCGLQVQDQARPIDRDQVPFDLLESTTTTLAVLRAEERACVVGDVVVSSSDDEVVLDIDVVERTAVVELAPGALGALAPDEQLLAVAQLTCSLSTDDEVDAVRFTQGGRSLEVPRADGSVTSDAVEPADYESLLGP